MEESLLTSMGVGKSNFFVMDDKKAWNITLSNESILVELEGRIDSFNFEDFRIELLPLFKDMQRMLIIEASRLEFLGLKGLQLIGEQAYQRMNAGKKPILVSPSEKLKRQIDIYTDLEHWEVFRNYDDLQSQFLERGPADGQLGVNP